MLESVIVDGAYFSAVSERRAVNLWHCIEASGFLLEEGLERGDNKLIDFAKRLFDISIERGILSLTAKKFTSK